jgi:caffeoyl-CoA O-methyltransferase
MPEIGKWIRLRRSLAVGRFRGGKGDKTLMKRVFPIAVVILALVLSGFAQPRRGQSRYLGQANPPLPMTEAEKRILDAAEAMVRANEMYANVPLNDARMLRLLTAAAGAKSVVEIGTSTGYSGLWFCMALEKTGGKLTTFDIDPGRIALARKHFQQAGVEGLVTIVEGDAHQTVTRLKGPIDVVFIDADKEGYVDYLNKLLPLVRPGGLILAHNTDMVPEYSKAVTNKPELETMFYNEGGGLAITLKKR